MRNQSFGTCWATARDELRARRTGRAAHRHGVNAIIERELATNVTSREVNELRAVLGRYDTPEVDRMHTLIYLRNVA